MTTLSFPIQNPTTANLSDLHLVVGRVLLDSTTPTVSAGKGFTVSKIATGRYKVTLNKKVRPIVAFGLLAKATGEAVFLCKPVLVADDNFVEFRVENSSGSNVDAAVTDELEFMIAVMRTTSLPR